VEIHYRDPATGNRTSAPAGVSKPAFRPPFAWDANPTLPSSAPPDAHDAPYDKFEPGEWAPQNEPGVPSNITDWAQSDFHGTPKGTFEQPGPSPDPHGE
jgi:hypothetical protein